MDAILEWAPLLVAVRGLAYLATLALSLVAVVGFARLMVGRLSFARLNLWGAEVDFSTAQHEQIVALQARVEQMENEQPALIAANEYAAETLKRLEARHVQRTGEDDRNA